MRGTSVHVHNVPTGGPTCSGVMYGPLRGAPVAPRRVSCSCLAYSDVAFSLQNVFCMNILSGTKFGTKQRCCNTGRTGTRHMNTLYVAKGPLKKKGHCFTSRSLHVGMWLRMNHGCSRSCCRVWAVPP